MKTFIKYLQVTLFIIGFSSCNDFLDVKPVGKLIPTEVTQYEQLLNDPNTIQKFMYDANKTCSYAVLGDNLEMSENLIKYFYRSTFPNLDMLAAYIYYTPLYNPQITPPGWSTGFYQQVATFNNVVDGINEIAPDDDYARGIIAQALVGRAWLYLNATLCYGPMWDPSTPNDTPTLPLRTSGDPTVENGPLATTAQLFAQVKSDLDYACEYAPIQVSNPCRANRAAAYALRAEYHMYMRNWQEMESDAAEAWKLALANASSVDNMIYDYNSFSYSQTSNVSVPEGVDPRYYMTLIATDGDFQISTNKENLLYRMGPITCSTLFRFYPSEDYLDNFDKSCDLRYDLFILMFSGYKGEVDKGFPFNDGIKPYNKSGDLSSNTQGLTYPMLLITKAEAEVRNGNSSEALKSLNLLRKYRYSGTNTDLANGSGLSPDQLLGEIINERRREQHMASFQRTVDLKRYQFDTGKPWCKTTIEHRAGDKVYSSSITSDFYRSLPIDNAIKAFNPQWGLPQDNSPFEPYNAW